MKAKQKISVWHFIKNFKFQSVFFSFFLSFLVIIASSFLIYGIILFRYYNYNAEQELMYYSEKMLGKSTEILDMINYDIERSFYTLSHHPAVSDWLARGTDFFRYPDERQKGQEIADHLFSTAA